MGEIVANRSDQHFFFESNRSRMDGGEEVAERTLTRVCEWSIARLQSWNGEKNTDE